MHNQCKQICQYTDTSAIFPNSFPNPVFILNFTHFHQFYRHEEVNIKIPFSLVLNRNITVAVIITFFQKLHSHGLDV